MNGIFQNNRSLGPILAITVTTEDAKASSEMYERAFGFKLLEEGSVSWKESLCWKAPATNGRKFSIVGYPGQHGAVRFVEGLHPPSYQPLRQVGWAALEMAVTDVEAVVSDIEIAGFEILRRPQSLKSSPALRAAQILGPSGEVIYLTQQLKDLPGFDLPTPLHPTDCVFVAVLGTHQLEKARAVYESLGGQRASDHPVAIGVINDAYGLDVGNKHRISSVQLAGKCLIEIDQYPDAAKQPSHSAGELPWGVAMVTLLSSGIDSISSLSPLRLLEHGESRAFGGVHRLILCGVEGEIIELIDSGTQLVNAKRVTTT